MSRAGRAACRLAWMMLVAGAALAMAEPGIVEVPAPERGSPSPAPRSENTERPWGDVVRGASAFRACVMCHAVEPGHQLTGPSLATIWGRAAGTVEGFTRYSTALRTSGLVWNEATLDRWLADPPGLVPGTVMAFRGTASATERADLVAFLKALGTGAPVPAVPPGPRPPLDLGRIAREYRVRSIRYCGDAYVITTETGETYPYWEYNLRFKTDSSARGPARGQPVLVPAGMQGDRAYVVFATPEEISARIERRCQP